MEDDEIARRPAAGLTQSGASGDPRAARGLCPPMCKHGWQTPRWPHPDASSSEKGRGATPHDPSLQLGTSGTRRHEDTYPFTQSSLEEEGVKGRLGPSSQAREGQHQWPVSA